MVCRGLPHALLGEQDRKKIDVGLSMVHTDKLPSRHSPNQEKEGTPRKRSVRRSYWCLSFRLVVLRPTAIRLRKPELKCNRYAKFFTRDD